VHTTHFIMAEHWGAIRHVGGDATFPFGEGNKIIVHICNDVGHWGGGFTEALDHRWFKPQIAYTHYAMLSSFEECMELGTTQVVKVEDDIWVVNLIGEQGTGNNIRYEAVRKGLRLVARIARRRNASVHMPGIGAGGHWNQIDPLIQQELINEGIRVTVYDD
jgi:O-acetyl-ADP-ribose deacetylase (regulator of RNase III)